MPIAYHWLGDSNTHLLANVATDVFDHAIDRGQLASFAADPRHLMMLAVDGATVIGFASACEVLHPDKPPQLFINEVSVAADYQRRGIGRTLVEMLLAAARERGCHQAWVGTEVDNSAARACYASVASGDAPETFVLYAWDLDG
ncbi:MAG: GNAT family N-acetyltransferase [Hyphomicrobiaceae bacterium]